MRIRTITKMNDAIKQAICGFVKSRSLRKSVATRWQTPLVGFADAADPLFAELKTAVSPTHALPTDLLKNARSVIAFFLPFPEDIADGNIAGRQSSHQWSEAYVETNALIANLNLYLQNWLRSAGYESVIIAATHNFDPERLISDWSHRHVAFIAGLGRFGLNNMLITEKGCCGRIGTIVTSCPTAASARPAEDYCLFRRNGTCGKCVRRCPCNALTAISYDRHRCYEMCLTNDKVYSDMPTTDVCGKCLVGVPCSFRNPANPG